jgi:hypothetical protein
MPYLAAETAQLVASSLTPASQNLFVLVVDSA